MTATLAHTLIRQDGRDKVTGSGRYAADLTLTGMLQRLQDRRGPPPASAGSIDGRARAARRACDHHGRQRPRGPIRRVPEGPTLFARDVVRWEGELIAAVAAAAPEIAAQAAALIDIDLEPLPAVTDLETAARSDAQLVHSAWATCRADENLVRDRNVASRSTIVKGDAEAGMADADIVVRDRYVADGSHAVPIEPRAIVADWQGDH
jgi:CO/xanthine dehydrogenase Mo-binding subunit